MAYATSSDYLNWVETDTVPPGIGRLMEVASTRIDELLIGAVYAVDSRSMPTDPDVIELFRRATIEQALYMVELGDSTGALSGMTAQTVGRVSWQRSQQSADAVSRYAPEAIAVLRSASVLPVLVDRWTRVRLQ